MAILKFLRNKRVPLSVLAICLYALFLRINNLYHHVFWTDELCELNKMQGSFFELLKALQGGDFCSFLSGDHYLIFPFFKAFGYNKWALALPHLAATLAGFYFLYLICQRHFKSIWGYLITFTIVCFNQTLVAHSTEIRPYAVLPTLSLATFYLFDRLGDNSFKLGTKAKLGVILFSVFVICFHVYGILMVSCCFLFAFLNGDKKQDLKAYFKRSFFIVSIPFAIVLPFWLYSVFGPHLTVPTQVVKPFEFIPNPLIYPLGFLKAIFGNLLGFKPLYFLLSGLIIPFFLPGRLKLRQILFLLIVVFLPIGFIFLFDVARKYWFLQRQFIWVMPLFAFSIGWAFDSVIRPRPPKENLI